MIFTARLERGKLLVCTFDVLNNLNGRRPEADYMFRILLDYTVSENFAARG